MNKTYLRTRYGTKVEFVELITDYVVILFNSKKVRVLKEDFDDASIDIINKIENDNIIKT